MLHEAEQKRLSQELERRVGGWLDIVQDALDAVAARCRDPRAATALAGPRRQLRRAAKATRQLAEELYPPVLDNMSLAFGLRECLTAFEQRTGACTSFHCSGNFQRVDSPARLLLYRIAHELFSCPLLSERPERVDMSLHQVNGSIQMQIQLRGAPPSTPAMAPSSATGPPSQFWLLQQRVRLLNGQFTADTDSGTTALVRVSLPLSPHPRDPRPS
jgi:signal transduction histidine kinase